MNLFLAQVGKFATHKATGTLCLIVGVQDTSQGFFYTLAVPQKDSKGKYTFCHATYSDREIEIEN